MKIIVATHNEGKLAEIRRILEERLGADAADIELVSAGSLGLPDPVEDGVTFQENALIKARDVAERTGCPAVADDSGLIVDVMGNAPGILSARWAGEHGNDKANNALLLKQLADIPDSKRTARFRCAAALVVPGERKTDGADDDKPYTIASETVEVGEMPGVLLRAPRGANGFGYDPLFVPNDQPQRAVDAGADLLVHRPDAHTRREVDLRIVVSERVIAPFLDFGEELLHRDILHVDRNFAVLRRRRNR